MRAAPGKDLILHSLVAFAKRAGRPPSRREFHAHSGLSEGAFSRFFPTWNSALRAAGLEPYTLNLRRQDYEFLEDWGQVARKNGRPPSRRTYHHLGKFDPRSLARRFGCWSRLPEAFRKFAQGKREWVDVLLLLPPFGPKPSPMAQPFPAARSLSPSQNDIPPNNVLGNAGAGSGPSSASPRKVRHRPLRNRPTYGQPIDFRGLRHEPVNEQGVVLLFGMVARELGYIVESVQSGFPDCEAKRRIGPQRWQRVHLEFEFESRNFRDRGHPAAGCDVIVCWRHNWPDYPAHLEILELSSLLPGLIGDAQAED